MSDDRRHYGREALRRAGLRPAPPRLVQAAPDLEDTHGGAPANDDRQPPAYEPDGPRAGDEILPDVAANATEAGPLDFVNVASLEGCDIPEREWLVPGRLPAGKVTLLLGDGGTGKTTIAQQLAAATVPDGIGSWLNATIERRGPAMILSAEEDQDEMHRRSQSIAEHHGRTLGAQDGLFIYGMVGQDALLGIADRSGIIRPTPLFARLLATAEIIQPVLIALDAAADLYGGNENARGEVRQFITLLQRLAMIRSKPAVLLLAHPSVAGIATGNGTSGSTGWSNSVRSRLYFVKASKGKSVDLSDDMRDDDIRELRVMKSNYGPDGECVPVRWTRGVFVPEASPGSLQRVAAEAEADAAYLDCLDTATAQGRHAFPKPGNGYAPKLFAAMPQAKKMNWRALAAAQERLFTAGRIHVVEHKRTRRVERKASPEYREAAE